MLFRSSLKRWQVFPPCGMPSPSSEASARTSPPVLWESVQSLLSYVYPFLYSLKRFSPAKIQLFCEIRSLLAEKVYFCICNGKDSKGSHRQLLCPLIYSAIFEAHSGISSTYCLNSLPSTKRKSNCASCPSTELS